MYDILKTVYYCLLFSVTLYALITFKTIRKNGGQLLAFALILSAGVEIVALAARWYKIKYLVVYNLYNLAIVPLYLWLLLESLPAKYRKLTVYVIGLFLLAGLANFAVLQGMRQFNNYTILLGATLIILFCMLYFKSRFETPQEDLLKSWRFWASTGLIMYFTGTLLYFGFLHYLHRLGPDWLVRVAIILQLMNIMLYTIFGIALLCLRRPQKLSPSY
ncbi:hypothetical protein [Rufibacter sp. LB8]|uniref:hypothetical protein n=1 Tax=Rufibacter sp. LB8 TaxID=2777781 RepID=UPI00178C6BFF|nr:hypothetical protein [Rufibacter sp. LB8]